MLWGGKPAAIIKAAEDLKLRILTSEEIITEISHVLTYPKLEKIYQAEGLRREDLIEKVLKIAKFVKATKKVQNNKDRTILSLRNYKSRISPFKK